MLVAAMLAAPQDPPGSPPPKPPAAAAADAAAAKATPAQRLEALQAEQKQLIADFRAKQREASAKAKEAAAAGVPIPAMPMRPDMKPLVEKANAAAAEYAGTDHAVPFLVFVVQSGDPVAAPEALDTLTLKHIDHATVAELAPMFGMIERIAPNRAPELLERVAKSANPDLSGWAVYGMHKQAIEKAALDSDGYKTAKVKLQKAAELAKDERLKGEVQGAIDLREKLSVGAVAPDIVGNDLDGVSFKLSDYRGKVVFLDFWGDW